MHRVCHRGRHELLRTLRIHGGIAALLVCGIAHAQQVDPTQMGARRSCGERMPDDLRPRVGLALGGGGARGIAHISVIEKLEELRIPVDCIAGTSMGALVGGLYASGMPVNEMRQLVLSTDWARLFDDSIERQERSYRRKQDDRDSLVTVGVGVGPKGLRISPGLLQGERVLAMFERETLAVATVEHFDDLPIPYRAIATDLNSGEAAVLERGSLAMAMRASMSLPGIFQPVEIDGRVLVDGGLANQVPIDVVRAMGADVVIAVDVGTPLARLDRDASLVGVLSQIVGMMTTGNTRRQLATLVAGDVLIAPELGSEVATGDFSKAREALAIGELAASAAAPRLAALTVPDSVYAASRTPSPAADPPVIDFIRLDNRTPYADEVLLAQLRLETGEPLDTVALEQRLLRIYSVGTIASVTYDVTREGERTGIVVRALPKPQGPNYVQLGLTHSSDFDGTYESTLRAALLASPLNPFGAEGRVMLAVGSEPALVGEYFHPFDARNRNLFHLRAGYENPNVNVYDERGNRIATYDVQFFGVRIQATRELGNYGAAALGMLYNAGDADVEVGDPALREFDFKQGAAYALANVDRLDSLFFPRTGYYAALMYTASRESLGSDSDYDQVDLDAVVAQSFDRHSLQLGVRYHVTTSGELPLQNRYRLGGKTRLAGFRINELTGQHYAVAYAGYSYQLAEVMGRSASVGGTIEFGNAWEDRKSMRLGDGIWNASASVGFDSWIGPMTFGLGWRENGKPVFFLELGRPF